MSTQRLPQHDDALDLLAERALAGLSTTDESRLNELLAAEGLDRLDEDAITEMDLAAAQLDAAMFAGETAPQEALDAAHRAAEAFTAGLAAPQPELKLAGTPRDPAVAQASNGYSIGGWLAAAACLVLAAIAWWPGSSATPPEPTLAQFVAETRTKQNAVTVAWSGLDDLALAEAPHQYDQELQGEVVWDADAGTGYMVFTGLADNDPTDFQYQLWIFDAERRLGDLPQFGLPGLDILTQRPVDGGVFDIGDAQRLADGRVIIPIDAKLPVGQAVLFAITVEEPGGAVVSDRDIVTAALVG